jgi:hypothetical protein
MPRRAVCFSSVAQRRPHRSRRAAAERRPIPNTGAARAAVGRAHLDARPRGRARTPPSGQRSGSATDRLLAPAAVRLHGHVSLSVSAAHDGLAWFLVYWKWRALRTGEERYDAAARFWAKIFGLNFAVGVVTGIPMEFQFGTNWAGFAKYAGGVIGQTLAMEGMFAFSSRARSSARWSGERSGSVGLHFLAAVGVATEAGSRATSSW